MPTVMHNNSPFNSLDRLGSTLAGEEVLITQERHRIHLQDCLQCLDTFLGRQLPDSIHSAARHVRAGEPR